MTKRDVKKVVLAYSGGLDTSIILKWLQQTYGCEVVTFTADLGQGEELGPAREKALMLGIKPENIFIEDLREEFVRDYVFPMFRANALVRGPVPARHVDRAAADRQEADRDRRARRRRRRGAWRHGKRQRPGAVRARLLRAQSVDQDRRALARMELQGPQRPDRLCPAAPDPDRQGQGGRGAVLGRRQPAALVLRRKSAGGPLRRGAVDRLSAHHLADGGARPRDRNSHRLQARRRRLDRWQADVARHAADEAQRTRQRQRHRPHRPGREPLRRHEVARRLRDAGRHHPDCRPSRHRVRSRSTAAPRISRTRSCRATPS